MKTLNSSAGPAKLAQLATGQGPKTTYRPGYEQFLEAMPVLEAGDPMVPFKVESTKLLMQKLAGSLKESVWVTDDMPKEFDRNVLAISEENNTEILVARWSDGYKSPIHGHADGYLHEEILSGTMMVSTYAIINHEARQVRAKELQRVTAGTFASQYNGTSQIEREHLVHSFTSVGQSATLHYLPEHIRNGVHNGFEAEYFEEYYNLTGDVTRITAQEGMYLRPGDVCLVRSENVPEYGDHYIIVTGPPEEKEHGMRPADIAIPAPYDKVLRGYKSRNGLVLLKLSAEAAKDFLRFHSYKLENGKVSFVNRKTTVPYA